MSSALTVREMTVPVGYSPVRRPGRHVYCRTPAPLLFPEAEEVPETNQHLEIRTAVYQSLKRELQATATIGSDQFVYWDPTTPTRCLAPDAFVRKGAPHYPFRTWKTWERGAPCLGVEIISESDGDDPSFTDKLARYRAAGIGEVVRFDPRDHLHPIRIWDAVDGDLVERAPSDPDLLACEALGLWWTTVEHPTIGPMLRLARGRDGRDLLATPDEAAAEARAAEGAARAAAVEARAAEGAARVIAAEARAAEIEARRAAERAAEANGALQAEVEALRAKLAGAGAKPRRRG